MTRGKDGLSGIRDWFRRDPSKRSIFEAFAAPPSQHALPAPKAKQLPAVQRASPFAVFRPEPPPPAPPPPPVPPAPPQETWRALFRPPEESKPVNPFEFARERRERPSYAFIPAPIPEPIHLPALPAPTRAWRPPTAEELAAHFQQTFTIDEMFERIRELRETPEFKKEQLVASWRGQPVLVPIDPVVYQEFYTDFANFYGIPIEG